MTGTASGAAEEMIAFAGKLAAGADTLAALGDVEVGTTPRERIAAFGESTLYRYTGADGSAPSGPPLLVVFALVNRPWVMDLEPERSTVRRLLESGLDVYLLEWEPPGDPEPGRDLARYVTGELDAAVDAVRARHGGAPVGLLGVCQGGTLSLCYAALEPAKVRDLVLMVTPVDFHTPDNLMSLWVRHVDVGLLVERLGNVPGEMLNWLFAALRPMRHTGRKYLELVDALDDPARLATFARMERWVHDSPPQAGAAFREFVETFFQSNALVRGEASIGGRPIDLARVTMPVLNVYASADHIVPPAAARALAGRTGASDYEELAFDGGHIGIYVSRRAQDRVAPAIARWVRARA